jgi:ribosome maturation factor RimP
LRVAAAAAAAARPPPPPPDLDDDGGEEVDALEPPEAEHAGVGVHTGGVPWGEAAASAAQAVLSTDPALAGLALWSLSADARAGRLSIRLDKPADQYGSPSLDEVAAFAAAFGPAFDAAAGADAAERVEVEVSSPGAERALRVPGDLARFAHLPMAVRLTESAAAAAVASGCGPPKGAPPRPPGSPFLFRLVAVRESGDGSIEWAPADVRANRGPTGRLTKAQKDGRAVVSAADVVDVTLHLDV